MPIWFWLNIPACTLVFLATAGIPLWLVLTRPDEKPIPGPGEFAQALPPAARKAGAVRSGYPGVLSQLAREHHRQLLAAADRRRLPRI